MTGSRVGAFYSILPLDMNEHSHSLRILRFAESTTQKHCICAWDVGGNLRFMTTLQALKTRRNTLINIIETDIMEVIDTKECPECGYPVEGPHVILRMQTRIKRHQVQELQADIRCQIELHTR